MKICSSPKTSAIFCNAVKEEIGKWIGESQYIQVSGLFNFGIPVAFS